MSGGVLLFSWPLSSYAHTLSLPPSCHRSRASRIGKYNVDPDVAFWATPPIHGCLRPFVNHPASFTYKVPDNVSFAEAALVEPLAVGMHSATKVGAWVAEDVNIYLYVSVLVVGGRVREGVDVRV